MSIEREAGEKENHKPPCCIPGCSDTSDTCQIWEKRTLCYPHFADYFVWSDQPKMYSRGPTDAEWMDFVRSLSRVAA